MKFKATRQERHQCGPYTGYCTREVEFEARWRWLARVMCFFMRLELQ